MIVRYRIATVFLLITVLMGCTSGRGPRYSTDDLGKKSVEALRSGNAQAFSQLIVSPREYRYLIGQMKRSRDYHDFSPAQRRDFVQKSMAIGKNYPHHLQQTAQSFQSLRQQGTQRYGIDWNRVQFATVHLYNSSAFMGQVRYDELDVIFTADSTRYALQVDGAIQIQDGWKLVANSLNLIPAP